MTDEIKAATDEQIRLIVSYLKIYEVQLGDEKGRWPIWSITDIHDVRTLIARIEQLKRAINSFGNNPNGFDWAVLDKIDQLERENERLRGLRGETK